MNLKKEKHDCFDPQGVIAHDYFYILFIPLVQLRHVYHARYLVHVNAQLPQIDLGQLNLLHELLVRRGDIVEGEDAPAETEEEERAEGNEGPEGELRTRKEQKLVACGQDSGVWFLGVSDVDVPLGRFLVGREVGGG